MKFGSSWAVKAPCKVNGIECPERTMGCRNDCERFAEYQKKLGNFKKNMFRHQDRERLLRGRTMRRYEEMKKLKEQGMTHRQIADAFGVSKKYADQLLAEYDSRYFQPFSQRRCIYVNLRKWLNRNKVSMAELIRRTGRAPYAVTSAQMRERFHGEMEWSEREIERVCGVTGLTKSQLLEVG